MKKLMMFAAASIVAGSASAAIKFVQNNDNCGGSKESTCAFVGFDFTEKGKLADYIEKKGYKTTTSFSAKGALGLVFEGTESGKAAAESSSDAGTSTSTAASGSDTYNTNYTTNADGTTATDADGEFLFSVETIKDSSTASAAGDDAAATECCFAPGYATLVLKMKVGGQKTVVAFDNLGITKLSFFGKKWEKIVDVLDGVGKSGKYYGVESDLGFLTGTRADGAVAASDYVVYYDGAGKDEEPAEALKGDSNAEIDSPVFIYSGFGKAKIGLTKQTTSGGNCGGVTKGCDPEVIFKKYKGWFAGYYPTVSDASDLDFTCESGCDYAIFGGTWTAKFNKKYTTKTRMLQKFGVSISED